MGVLDIGSADKERMLSGMKTARRIFQIMDENAITIQELLEAIPGMVVFALTDPEGKISASDVVLFNGTLLWNIHGLLMEPLKDRIRPIGEVQQ